MINSCQIVAVVAPAFGGASLPVFVLSVSHALAKMRRNVCVLIKDGFFIDGFYPNTKVLQLDEHIAKTLAQAASQPDCAITIVICSNMEEALGRLPDACSWFSLVLIYWEAGMDLKINPTHAASISYWVLLLNPTIQSLAQAQNWMRSLLSQGIKTENRELILLDEGIAGGLKRHQIKERLPQLEKYFPCDALLVQRAQNEGKIVISVPAYALADDIEQHLKSCRKQVQRARLSLESLNDIERIVSARLWARLGHEQAGIKGGKAEVEKDIDREFHQALREFGFSEMEPQEAAQAKKAVRDYVLGLGPLEKLQADPLVGEILVNGTDHIYVEREGSLRKTALAFINEAQLRVVIERIVAEAGRRVDVASPFCDVRLKDGSRVNVVLPPLSLEGPLISIRRFRSCFMELDDLIQAGSLTPVEAETLMSKVKNRANILIAGNTGSGKTTLLNILSGFIDPLERIITLEDAAELKLQQPHVVRLETRPKNAEGKGEVTMSELLINALRMRPDRIIVGECRGAEAIPMIQAMNTGHDGSMTTIHANSAIDAIQRLESMILLGAPQWPIDVVRRQIGAGIDVILFLKRQSGARKLVEMVTVSYKAGDLITEVI